MRWVKWGIIGIFCILMLTLVPGKVSAVVGGLEVTPGPTPVIWTVDDATANGLPAWHADEQVTVVGKRAERARQFINWVLLSPSIDNHPVFRQIWLVSAATALFLIIIVVGLMGVSVLLARKRDVSFGVDIVPILYKAIMLIAYVAFSYLIVLSLIQLTDLLMSFFIKTLGGDQLFKIFFANQDNTTSNPYFTSEEGYRNFVGYKRTGVMYSESAKTSTFLVDFTSFTYFALGIMLLLRKIVLWFLLVVSPFLAILMPFIFIRNIGWIWIGTFFQWAFYGPLVALFLGALSKIWAAGIPFMFNFSRVKENCEPVIFNKAHADCASQAALATKGIVYPLAINILYGGPAQQPQGLGQSLAGNINGAPVNSSSYVDTFAEYVISLIMLWTVIILPWWLLRIFRDYCCDGIYAMRNILMQMMNGNGLGPQAPTPTPTPRNTNIHEPAKAELSKEAVSRIEKSVGERITAIENIKTVETSRIAEKLEVRASSLKDVAQFETRAEKKEYFNRLADHMKNPMSAENASDRAAFVKLKTEMSERAVQGDQLAERILAATTATSVVMNQRIQTIAHDRPAINTMSNSLSRALTLQTQQIQNVLNTWSTAMTQQVQELSRIAKSVNTTEQSVKKVVEALPTAVSQATTQNLVEKVSEKSTVSKETTRAVLKEAVAPSVQNTAVVQAVAKQSNVSAPAVQKVLEAVDKKVAPPATKEQMKAGVTPKVETSVDEAIDEHDSLSLDEYEEIKQLWMNHYLHGEIPVSETIKTREDWIEHDMVTIENTLNKLISENEEIRAEGLKQVADSIPFFVLANMSMQDIAVYLKAKRSAAKEVKELLTRESAVKAKIEARLEDEDTLVEKKEVKAEKPKEMTMEMEEK